MYRHTVRTQIHYIFKSIQHINYMFRLLLGHHQVVLNVLNGRNMQLIRCILLNNILELCSDCTGLFEMTVGGLKQLVIHDTLERGEYVFFYLTFRHRASYIQDRHFATLQRTLFIYLINKYISLSDICLTVHH